MKLGRGNHLHQRECAIGAAVAVVVLGQLPQCVTGDHGVFAVQPRLHQHRARRRISVGQVVGDRDDGPEPGFAVPALRQDLECLACDHGVMPDVGEIGDRQPFADDQVALRGSPR